MAHGNSPRYVHNTREGVGLTGSTGAPHKLTADTEIEGYLLPKGTIVLGNVWYVCLLRSPFAGVFLRSSTADGYYLGARGGMLKLYTGESCMTRGTSPSHTNSNRSDSSVRRMRRNSITMNERGPQPWLTLGTMRLGMEGGEVTLLSLAFDLDSLSWVQCMSGP